MVNFIINHKFLFIFNVNTAKVKSALGPSYPPSVGSRGFDRRLFLVLVRLCRQGASDDLH